MSRSRAIAYGRRAVHADLPVPVERDEAERRVELLVDDLEVEPEAVADRLPVGEARAAERVDAEPQAGAADRVEVDHRAEVVDVGGDVVALGDRAACGARHVVQPAARAARSRRRSIQPVTSVSAGPPCGGLYLKPPSPGGLCEGVTTIPSAGGLCARLPPWLWVRIACEMTGVGVAPPSRRRPRRRRAPASTSTIVSKAGAGERVRVARRGRAGRSSPARRGTRQTAALIATTCASVNEPSSEVPRWPDVPNATGAPAAARSTRRAARRRRRGRRSSGQPAGTRIHAHAADIPYRCAREPELDPRRGGGADRSRPGGRTGRSPRTPAAARSTPRVRSAGWGVPSPTSAASRPTASARGWRRCSRRTACGSTPHVRTDDPTTLALAELDAAAPRRTASTRRARRPPGLTPRPRWAPCRRTRRTCTSARSGWCWSRWRPRSRRWSARLAGRALVMLDPNCRPAIIADAAALPRAARPRAARTPTWSRSPTRTSPGSRRACRRGRGARAARPAAAARPAHPRRRRARLALTRRPRARGRRPAGRRSSTRSARATRSAAAGSPGGRSTAWGATRSATRDAVAEATRVRLPRRRAHLRARGRRPPRATSSAEPAPPRVYTRVTWAHDRRRPPAHVPRRPGGDDPRHGPRLALASPATRPSPTSRARSTARRCWPGRRSSR